MSDVNKAGAELADAVRRLLPLINDGPRGQMVTETDLVLGSLRSALRTYDAAVEESSKLQLECPTCGLVGAHKFSCYSGGLAEVPTAVLDAWLERIQDAFREGRTTSPGGVANLLSELAYERRTMSQRLEKIKEWADFNFGQNDPDPQAQQLYEILGYRTRRPQ